MRRVVARCRPALSDLAPFTTPPGLAALIPSGTTKSLGGCYAAPRAPGGLPGRGQSPSPVPVSPQRAAVFSRGPVSTSSAIGSSSSGNRGSRLAAAPRAPAAAAAAARPRTVRTAPVSAAAKAAEKAELPFSVYTPAANAEYWSTRPVAVMTRGVQIAAALGSWFMEGRVTNRGATAQGLTDIRADKLRTLLTDLGPAFVKIGQAVSSRWVAGWLGGRRGGGGTPARCLPTPTRFCAVLVPVIPRRHPSCACLPNRPDVAPPEFLRELEKLQDQIPPFCNDQASGAAPGAPGEGLAAAEAQQRETWNVRMPGGAQEWDRSSSCLCPSPPCLQAFEVIQAEYGVASVSEIFSAISPEAVAGRRAGGGWQSLRRTDGRAAAVQRVQHG